MSEHKVISIIDGQPTFEKPLNEILASLKQGGALKTLSPLEYHTDQQRKWYRGPCLNGLAQWNGDTVGDWDLRLKADCGGNELLRKEAIMFADGNICTRLTISGVGKKNMTAYIENILSKALEQDWPVTPPDPDLRTGR